jgi:predicted nucleotidyltransferase
MIPLVDERRKQIVEVCRRRRVRRLDLFGSAVGGGYDPESSDLDFLVEFLPLQRGEHAEAYFGLMEDLQALFGRSVDLVVERAITNPYFRQAVDETRETVYAA